MISKGDKLYSILKFKCPHCHEGQFYVSHPYNLKHVGEINKACPNCHRPLQKETGFYFGAMYVSYGLGVGIFVFGFILFSLVFPTTTTEVKIISMVATMLILGPWLHALSKIIWANVFMHYQKD